MLKGRRIVQVLVVAVLAASSFPVGVRAQAKLPELEIKDGKGQVDSALNKDDLKIARGGWDILKRNLDRIVSLTLNMLAFSRQRAVEPSLTPLGSGSPSVR